MLKLQIGETSRTEYYTAYRSFGRLTFALSDYVDRDAMHRQLTGDDEPISADSIAFAISEHNMFPIAQYTFVRLDTADLLWAGAFDVRFNEHTINNNEAAGARLKNILEKIVEAIEIEGDSTKIMVDTEV